MTGKTDNIDQELAKLMEEFRNADHGDFSMEIYELLTQATIERAEGEMTVSVKRGVAGPLTRISGNGNAAAVLVACFNLVKMAIARTDALTFEDVLKIISCMKEHDLDLAKSRREKQ